jgi:hypothetical protein
MAAIVQSSSSRAPLIGGASLPAHGFTSRAVTAKPPLIFPAMQRVGWPRRQNMPTMQGNDVFCDLPIEATAIIEASPRKAKEIFPYSVDTVSAAFTRACKLLERVD